MDIKIFSNNVCEVYYNAEMKVGKITWSDTPSSFEYKEPFIFLKGYIKTNPIVYFISDITNQGVNSNENRKWFEKEIIPSVIEEGIKKVAIISNNNLLKKLYFYIMIMTLKKSDLPVRFFSNETQSIEWFKNKD